MIKFSIIMTAYNAEKYIIECVHSILKNDYTNFELIIINDGSSDSTEELINSLNDKRIRLINTEHIGNANAKNTGITYATGDYILFIDSDDLFASNILTILTNEIEQSHADLFIFQWALFQSRVGESEVSPQGNISIDGMGTAVWNKLYSHAIIKQISFPKDTIFEDVAFSAQAFLRADQIVFIPRVLYYYRQHKASLTKMGHEPEEHLDIITDFSCLIKDVNSLNFTISSAELSQIGILIHKLVLDHIKSILRENEMNKNTFTVLNDLSCFLKQISFQFKPVYSKNRIENLKAKYLVLLIRLHLYRLATLMFNWKNIMK